jgi:hypothetical protein
MADEPIQVKVTDEVAPSIAVKLDSITKKARDGYGAVNRLKSALRNIDSGAINALSLANSRAQKMMNDSALAAQRLQTENLRSANAANLAAASANKLAAANAETARIQITSAAAIQKALTGQRAANAQLAAEQNKAAAAAARAAVEQQKSVIVQQRLQTETHKTSAASIQAAAAQQKLLTSATQTATAQQALTAAASRAATAQTQQAAAASNAATAQSRAALAALRLQQAQTRANKSQQDAAKDAERLKRELFPLYDAQQTFNASLARANGLLAAGAIDEKTYAAAVLQSKNALLQATAANNTFNASQARSGKQSQINRAHLTNLSFQLNDIAVSLASGQNPLIVLVQQGSQIAGIASQAGVSLGRLAIAAGAMLLPFLPLVAALGSFVGLLKLVASEASKGAELDKFAKGLGASDKEIKRLNLGVVTLGDSMRGLWKTIDDATGIGDIFAKIGSGIVGGFKFVLNAVANIFSSIISLGAAAVDTIVLNWESFPNRFKVVISNASNFAIEAFEKFINFTIRGLNAIIDGLNKISPKDIPNIAEIALEKIDVSKFDAPAQSLADTFVNSYMEHMQSNQDAVNKFMAKWQSNSVEAAKKRIREALQDDKAEESRALSLAKINAQLDNEYRRMLMVGSEREKQQRFDQIEEQLIGKKIKLTKDEANAIRERIAAIVDSAGAAAAYVKVVESTVAPAKALADALSAQLLAIRGTTEMQAEASRQVMIAREAYANSIDPMRQFNKELEQQNDLLRMLPREREISQQIQQEENRLLAEGRELNVAQATALRLRLIAQQQLNIASQAEAGIWESTRGAREKYLADMAAIAKLKKDGTITGGEAAQKIIENNGNLDFSGTGTEHKARLEAYAKAVQQIKDLQREELISERTASQMRIRLWSEEQAAKFTIAQGALSNIASLMGSKNKTLFKIGKAAAIANATIEGTKAVMTALSTTNNYYVNAGLAVAAGIQAAQNIARIKATEMQGFQRGGYTGDMPTNARAGWVHGKEFVFDAPSTARIGVENLERIRAGQAVSSGSRVPNITIEQYGTPQKYEVAEISEDRIRMIAKDEADSAVKNKAPKLIASEIANGNSVVSKSLDRNTQTVRRRN